MRSLAAGRNLYKIAHQKIIIGTKCKLKRRVDFRVGVGSHRGGVWRWSQIKSSSRGTFEIWSRSHRYPSRQPLQVSEARVGWRR